MDNVQYLGNAPPTGDVKDVPTLSKYLESMGFTVEHNRVAKTWYGTGKNENKSSTSGQVGGTSKGYDVQYNSNIPLIKLQG